MTQTFSNRTEAPDVEGPAGDRPPVIRAAIAGVLMGLANLVPGISGGTMILVMGLYDAFISSIADIVRFRLTKRNVLLLAVIVFSAGASIVALAGVLSRAVTLHRSAMFSLFIGLTLGGVPTLMRMLKRPSAASLFGVAIGLGIMLVIAITREEPPNREAIRSAVEAGTFVVEPSYGRDVLAGVLGLAAMILPGVSGAYMLLILGRYETILAAIALARRYVTSLGHDGDPMTFLRVLTPTALGAIASLVVFSNLIKWMLHRYESLTVGMLLGILLGSVIGIWPFDAAASPWDYALGLALAATGFGATMGLSRLTV